MSNSETLLRELANKIIYNNCCCECSHNKDLKRHARNILNQKELENPCPKCDGTGDGHGGIGGDTRCLDCGGTGKRSK